MSNKSLAVIQSDEFAVMRQQAEIVVASGFLPKSVDTWQKALTIMMQGRELGIGTMASLRGIDVIGGTPAVKPQLMLALIERSGELEDITITDDGTACFVTMQRRGRQPHTERFGVDDAKRMMTTEWTNNKKTTIPLTDKYNWKQMPEVMRKWRAVAACARVVFPDHIMGLYTQDELGSDVAYTSDGDIVETGEVIEGSFSAARPPEPPTDPAPESDAPPAEALPATRTRGKRQPLPADVEIFCCPNCGEIGQREWMNEDGTCPNCESLSELDAHFGDPDPSDEHWADDETVRNLTYTCRDTLWPSDPPMTWPHIYNRIVKALGLEGKPGNRNDLAGMIRAQFTESKSVAKQMLYDYQPDAE